MVTPKVSLFTACIGTAMVVAGGGGGGGGGNISFVALYAGSGGLGPMVKPLERQNLLFRMGVASTSSTCEPSDAKPR